MTARDELAELIQDCGEYIPGSHADDYISPDKAADAILAAGFRKPRTITTAAEREILRPGTICVDKDGNAWKRGAGSWVSTGGDTAPLYDDDDLELTILHEGTQP